MRARGVQPCPAERGLLESRAMKRVFAALALLAALAAPALADADARTEEDRRAFADALFSRGLYRQAAVEYARFLDEFPKSADYALACFRLGESHRSAGDKVEALKAYKRAIDAPDSPWRGKAMFKRAALFAEMGQNEAAEELFAKLLAAGPEPEVRELALYYDAAALEGLGRNADAVARLETLVKDFPKGSMTSYGRLSLARLRTLQGPTFDPAKARGLLADLAKDPATPRLGAEALFLLGSAERAAGNEGAAADAFRALFDRYPQDERVADARIPAAWAFSRAGRAQDAIATVDAALAASPVPAPAAAAELRYVRAQALFDLARLEEAGAAFLEIAGNPAAAASGFAARARYQAALCAFKRGQWTAAREAARPLLSDKAMREEALWLLAQASSEEGGKALDEAIESYRRIAAEFPESSYAPGALFRLAHALRGRGDSAAAIAAFETLAEKYPKSDLAPRARFSAAHALGGAGQDDRAVVAWRTYLRDFPSHEGAEEGLWQLGVLLLRLDRRTEALADFDELLRRFPKGARRADALLWRGELLREADDPAPAERALRDALAANPREEVARDARFALATVLQKSGRESEAAELLQGLLDGPAAASRFTPGQFAWLAERQIEGGKFAQAATTARRMAELAPDDSWRQTAWTLAGRAERAAGRAREAEEAFRRACELNVLTASAPEATLRLAELLLARGAAEEADKWFRLAVERCAAPELQAQRIWAYVGLGRAALARGEKDDAARYLSTVCLLYRDPEILPPVIEETARLLDELGRADEAAAMRDLLAKDYPDRKEGAAK